MADLLEVARTSVELLRLLPSLRRKGQSDAAGDDAADSIGSAIEETARRHGHRTAILFEETSLTWSRFNADANRAAAVFQSAGIVRGDVVGLLVGNRPEMLVCLVGLMKVGATAALLNWNLRSDQLAHCASVSDCRHFIVGTENAATFTEMTEVHGFATTGTVLGVSDGDAGVLPRGAADLLALMRDATPGDPPSTRAVRTADVAFYMFTSGTTGLPKATKFTHRRFLKVARDMARFGFRCTAVDRMYCCLPLYHGTGLVVGVGVCMVSGASFFLRRKFSASRFLDEARRYETNLFIYVGELCRFLLSTPVRDNDARNPLRTAVGNGLQPEIWERFKARFGIRRICEFYGAAETPAGFANLLNKDRTIGMAGTEFRLVSFDPDEHTLRRDSSQRPVPVVPGEAGLLILPIRDFSRYEGYTDAGATEDKLFRDLFEPGDVWLNTGDLIRQVDVGFTFGIPHFQFVDRIGDTFRWKSENVSTLEVEATLCESPAVERCCVYGVKVPAHDGRAGMAAIVLSAPDDPFDADAFARWVRDRLPGFACPVFLRITDSLETTGNFKKVKGALRSEGFDLSRVRDRLFVLSSETGRYEPITETVHAQIQAGAFGL